MCIAVVCALLLVEHVFLRRITYKLCVHFWSSLFLWINEDRRLVAVFRCCV